MKKGVIANLILLVVLSACSTQGLYEKLADGIVVSPRDPSAAKRIKLEVLSDNIIHVLACPADTFSKSKSLVLLPDLQHTASWMLAEGDDEVTLSTSKLRVRVSLVTGDVTFLDEHGNVVLQEQKNQGRSFTATTVEGQPSYHIKQVFESADDEAFYGLGAHQNGQMNYKGQDVELVQHNIVDVVPFLYSNKNYGILWDNYSISKFGDPRDYESLNSIKLFDRSEKEGGLTVDYYVDGKIKNTAIEDKIEYEFLETPAVQNFPKDVSRHGKVVWEGWVASDAAGTHKFQIGFQTILSFQYGASRSS